ncbi:hypothetical protein DSM117340_00053 [Lentibacter algarum]
MRHFFLTSTTALALASGSAAFANDLRNEALELFAPLPSTIPALNANPVTPEKIDLGKALFLIRACQRLVFFPATLATTSPRAGTTICQHLLATVGRKARVTRPPC